MAPLIFLKKLLLLLCVLILAMLFYKITFFFPLNNIIDYFKSNAILIKKFYKIFVNYFSSKFLLVRIWTHHSHYFFTY